jgi:hypothetical protein
VPIAALVLLGLGGGHSVDPAINSSRNEGAEFFKPATNTL